MVLQAQAARMPITQNKLNNGNINNDNDAGDLCQGQARKHGAHLHHHNHRNSSLPQLQHQEHPRKHDRFLHNWKHYEKHSSF